MSQFFKVTNDGEKRRRGAIIEAISSLRPGETVLLPTSATSATSTIGNLRKQGHGRLGEFCVQSAGPRAARVWRLKLDDDPGSSA